MRVCSLLPRVKNTRRADKTVSRSVCAEGTTFSTILVRAFPSCSFIVHRSGVEAESCDGRHQHSEHEHERVFSGSCWWFGGAIVSSSFFYSGR